MKELYLSPKQQRAQSGWTRPKQCPNSWQYTIAAHTGTMFYLGSQDRAGLVNSLTVHGIFAAEAKFLNKKRFYEDAIRKHQINSNLLDAILKR